MCKLLFFRMAATNIRKNRQTYLPFILTCVGASALYYILGALTMSENVASIYGGNSIQIILQLGKWIIGIFSAIFLFYTNSFLLKRRKKEFGLYNILGLEKRHVAVILFLENFYTAVISVVFGIFMGLLLYKGVFLFLTSLSHFDVVLGFEIIWPIIRETVILFGFIFIILYINGFRQIQCSEPIELLKGGQVGEREPKTRWLLVLTGFISLALGYFLAVTIESPMEALVMFFVAVVLVIIGTYCLFTAGSIFVLKVMRKNKQYYYSPRHFTMIAGMIYRMKQNAAGLASICIMSTAVLLSMSTTACLYLGMADILRTNYPRDLVTTFKNVKTEEVSQLHKTVEKTVSSFGAALENEESYRYQSLIVNQNGNELNVEGENRYNGNYATVYLLGLEDYEAVTGERWELLPDEVLIQTVHRTQKEAPQGEMILNGRTWKIKEAVSGLDSVDGQIAMLVNCYYVVFPTFEDVEQVCRTALELKEGEDVGWMYYCSFDVNIDKQSQKDLAQIMNKTLFGSDSNTYGGYTESAAVNEEEISVLYGGIFFIGIFLGILFLMATVLIIYYKQVSEGYEDHDRFVIMQKVGMDKQEVRRSINSQIRTVFLLPVIMAGIHIIFAYPMMRRILFLFGLTNQNIFMITILVTFLIFLLFYAVVYSLTAKTYYRLVRW